MSDTSISSATSTRVPVPGTDQGARSDQAALAVGGDADRAPVHRQRGSRQDNQDQTDRPGRSGNATPPWNTWAMEHVAMAMNLLMKALEDDDTACGIRIRYRNSTAGIRDGEAEYLMNLLMAKTGDIGDLFEGQFLDQAHIENWPEEDVKADLQSAKRDLAQCCHGVMQDFLKGPTRR